MDWKLLIEFIYDKVIQVQLQKIENSNYLSPIYPLCYFTGFYSLNWKMEFFFYGGRLSKLHCNFSFEMAIRLVKNGSLERNDSVTLSHCLKPRIGRRAIWHHNYRHRKYHIFLILSKLACNP